MPETGPRRHPGDGTPDRPLPLPPERHWTGVRDLGASAQALMLLNAWLTEEDLRGLEEGGVEQLRLGQRLVERNAHDLGAAQGDHLPEVAVRGGVDGGHAEAGAEHAVV